jgi:hypothetical protein
MRRVLPLVLLLAACGPSRPAENGYLPDLTTQQGALEVFVRSVETGNLALAGVAVAPAARQDAMEVLRESQHFAQVSGRRWELETGETETRGDDLARTRVKYWLVDANGGRELHTEGWVIFARLEDGRWRFALPGAPRENVPPAPGGDPPEKDAPEQSPAGEND